METIIEIPEVIHLMPNKESASIFVKEGFNILTTSFEIQTYEREPKAKIKLKVFRGEGYTISKEFDLLRSGDILNFLPVTKKDFPTHHYFIQFKADKELFFYINLIKE
jgi:hypothetical protein